MEKGLLAAALVFCIALLVLLVRRLIAGGANQQQVQATALEHRQQYLSTVSSALAGTFDFFQYAAVYTFSYKGKEYQVVDKVARNKPVPATGSTVTLVFPQGEPEKAQPRRTWLPLIFSGFLLFAAAAILRLLLTV